MGKKLFKIIFTNDIHSNIPHAVSLFEKLYKFKENNYFIIDVGDFIEGSPFFNLFKGEPEMKIVNIIYDILVPGNHGFLQICKLYLSSSRKTVLNINIYKQGDVFFNKLHIVKREGLKVAFIGIISCEAFNSIETKFRDQYNVIEPEKPLLQVLTSLRGIVDYIIVLSHSGVKHDKKIFKNLKEIDILISSHCHSNFKKLEVGNRYMLKAPEMGQGFGEILLSKRSIHTRIHTLINSHSLFTNKNLGFLNFYLNHYKNYYLKKKFLLIKDYLNSQRTLT